MKEKTVIREIVSGFQIDDTDVDQAPLSQVAEVVRLKEKYSLSGKQEKERNIVKKELAKLIADAINQYCQSYLDLFEEEREQMQEALLGDCREAIAEDVDHLFRKDYEMHFEEVLRGTEKGGMPPYFEEMSATIINSVANGLSSISESFRKKKKKD